MNTRQIADAGVALVKSKLLRLGIHASVATDHWTELWVDEQRLGGRSVVRVTTNERPKPGGGKGALAVDWWVKDDIAANAVAFVDLSTESVWLMTTAEVAALAQQRSRGRLHFNMYIDRNVESRTGLANRVEDFRSYLIEARATDVLTKRTVR